MVNRCYANSTVSVVAAASTQPGSPFGPGKRELK